MRLAARGRRRPPGSRGEWWPGAAAEELAPQPVPSGRAPPSAATCGSPPGLSKPGPGPCGLSVPQRQYRGVRQLGDSAFGSVARGTSGAARSGERGGAAALPATF